jgi:transmembrane sensor
VGTSDPLLEKIPFGDLAIPHTPALSQLTAGQEAELRGTAVVVRRLNSDQLARAVSWRAGTLYFENEPLSAVIEKLSRYTPLTLEVPDATLRELSVAGTFQANPQGVQTFLMMLQQGLGLVVHQDGNRVVIERSGPSVR